MNAPWRDRRGRFVPIKAAALAAAVAPALFYAVLWSVVGLGPRPLNEAIHSVGLWGIRWLMIALAITPLARALDWSGLLLVRRMVGLTALAWLGVHFSLFLADQEFDLVAAASEIVDRLYLTLGFVVLLGLIALGATSTDAAVRRMGRWWKRLHRLAYPLGAAGLLHYFIQSKANVSEPVYVAGLFAWLMFWRLLLSGWRARPLAYLALAPLAGAAAAGIEFAWYGLATRINPWRVLAANETISFGLRPAHYVALTALLVALVVLLRRFGIPRSTRRPVAYRAPAPATERSGS